MNLEKIPFFICLLICIVAFSRSYYCDIHCILRLSSQGQDLWLYWERLVVSRTFGLYWQLLLILLRYQIVRKLFSCYREVLKIMVVPVSLLCLSKCNILVLLFKCNVLVPIAQSYLVGVPYWWQIRTSAVGQLLL